MTGPFNGVHWHDQAVDDSTMSGHVVDFYLGKLTGSGRGLLYLEAREADHNALKRGASRVITWAPPATSHAAAARH